MNEFNFRYDLYFDNGVEAFIDGIHRELPEEQGSDALEPRYIRAWQRGWDFALQCSLSAEVPF